MAKIQSKPTGANPAGKRSAPPSAAARPVVSTASAPKEKAGFRPSVHLLYASGVALITWLFLKVCTNNLLTNWDDPGYIKDNPYIKDISPEGIKQIFTVP